MQGTCFSNQYDDQAYREVSKGPLISQMQGMFLKGKSVLEAEIEGCMKIPEEERVFYRDHIMNEEGEGEPHGRDEEIVIASNMDAKAIYNFKIK